MAARRVLALALGTLVLSFATTRPAAAQTADMVEEIKRLRLELQLLAAQKVQPKAAPKVPLPAPGTGMPDGAIARLGDSRLRHAAAPKCVVFSPDGKRVFSGGEDNMLRVWDAATGESAGTLRFPDGALRQLRFTASGTRLAVQFDNSQIRFLDPTTLKETSDFAAEFGTEFATSADGSLVAHPSANGLLRVTEMATGLEMLELPAGSPFAFLPSGKQLAVADKQGKVTLFMVAGGKPVLTLDHGAPVTGLLIDATGKRLLTGGIDAGGVELVRVWDISDGKSAKPVADIKGVSRPRAWLGTDRVALGGSAAVGVYDLREKKWVGQVKGVAGEWALSPDGTTVASTGTGGLRIRMWDVATGKQLHAENDTFPDATLLAPAADGKTLFLLAGESAFHWDTSKSIASGAGALPGRAVHAATSKGRLAVAVPDAVLIYDNFDPTKPLPAKPSRTITENATGCRALAVSPDGKLVAYSANDTKTTVADAATGEPVHALPTQTAGIALAFTPDSNGLAMIGRDGFLRLWSARAPKGDDVAVWSSRVQRGQKGAIGISPDGKLIAASSSGIVKVVGATDGVEAFTVGNLFDHGLFQQLTFTPDSRLLVSASEGSSGGVQVWEVATQSLVRKFTTGFGTVSRIGVFASGTRIASAGAEEVITVWDFAPHRASIIPCADELAAWCALDSVEGTKGFPALQSLVAGGKRGVSAIAAGITEAAEARVKIAQWVKDLSASEFEDRERATKALVSQGFRALPAALNAAASTDSAEAKRRGADILMQLTAKGFVVPAHGLAGDDLRFLRATQVLEDIGGADAKAQLERIAKMTGPAAEAAQAALKRMK